MAKEQQGATLDTGAAAWKPAAAATQEGIQEERERRVLPHGIVHVAASFNNTQITITDTDGRTMCWSSAGAMG